MLKYKADIKSVIYLVITTALLVTLWSIGSLHSWWVVLLWLCQCFMAVTIAVIVHNHNHIPMWTNKWLNRFTDNLLTVYYGFPIWSWIPTHNRNHHVHVNKEPDYTRTYAVSEKNNMFTLLTYPTISGFMQQNALGTFMKEVYGRNKEKFWFYVLQVVSLVVWIAVAFLIDWKKALLFVVIPQQVSLFTVLVFNYVQHVHADEESKFNHSRNIESSLNFFLLNNGLHTVHHLYPGLHWSQLGPKHDEIREKIDPQLIEKSFWWYIIRVYVLGMFFPKLRTHNMRLERIEKEQKASVAA